ncbi:hypothetical protein TraAM80_07147 [Trypanosoma rangeli]|uniref:Uncharacterized protein n=1 Tax=Trypanosoma rangeli TaxID=5698 RepID=A0A3S5IQM7_TRYRA|nr:uncharacterized protein TraAM80_07147 [Trypanosoma rangeli]RNF01209.1 hypothetical protein TraAM80_07147 [Trypanosoma rangeli]|eukprot:RNF01209.1 hypothetical protein TraAM80_07147 [Trypanosoma rangeli]
MPKSLKVNNVASRIALVEFLVDKRVRFLEYLSSLHRGEALWMGTVRLTRADVLHCFRDHSNRHKEGYTTTTYQLPSAQGTAMSPPSSSSSLLFTNDKCVGDLVVSVGPIPGVPHTVDAAWLSTRMPCYVCLAMSLADILHIPLSVCEFVDCVYAMLLEMAVRFGSGATARAFARRNLRSYRQRQQLRQHTALTTDSASALGAGINHSTSNSSTSSGGGGLLGAMGSAGGGWFLFGASDADAPVKYLYLNLEHHAYTTPEEVRYEEVIDPLLSLLTLTYRRLRDHGVANNEESVKRVLSIDRRLQDIFFSPISKELGKIARGKLLLQTSLLSPSGLFANLGSTTCNNTLGLLRDLLGPAAGAVTAPTASLQGGTATGTTGTGLPDIFMGDCEEELEEDEEDEDDV